MSTPEPLRTVVWGTGNMGRAAIRAVDAHPGLELVAVIVANPDKVGRDAGDLAGGDAAGGTLCGIFRRVAGAASARVHLFPLVH